MDLEFLVLIPTKIGPISIALKDDGRDLTTFLMADEKDKTFFRSFGGINPNELPLADKIELVSDLNLPGFEKILVYDVVNEEENYYDLNRQLADLTVDAYTSSVRYCILMYSKKELKVRNNVLFYYTKRDIVAYAAAFGLIAASPFYESKALILGGIAVSLLTGNFIYDRINHYRSNKAFKQKKYALREALLNTGWFAAVYSK